MDARAMEDHDWDDCGDEIARLFQSDHAKYRAIKAAWWDLDEDDQIVIHEFLCDDSRDPDAVEKMQTFEKLAQKYEEKFRAEEAKRLKRRLADAATAKLDAAMTAGHVSGGTMNGGDVSGGTAADAGAVRYKTENAW